MQPRVKDVFRERFCKGKFFLPHFLLYVCSLWVAFIKYGVTFQCYTGDTQLYLPLRHSTNSFDSLLVFY